MKLVSEMKEFLILNDFTSVNTTIQQKLLALSEMNDRTEEELLTLTNSFVSNLQDLRQ